MKQCPYCKGERIYISTRGYSFWSGFIGSKKIKYMCLDCGYKTHFVPENDSYIKYKYGKSKKELKKALILLGIGITLVLFVKIVLGV